MKLSEINNVYNVSNVSDISLTKKGICIVCGKEYKEHQRRQKYCSDPCRVKGNRDGKKQEFDFLEREYNKPKIVKNKVVKRNIDWIHLEERIVKHQKQLATLKYSKKETESELSKLADKSKNTIIYALIGAGITTVGGYILYEYTKTKSTKSTKKDQLGNILKISAGIPIGVLIASLAFLGAGIGYSTAFIQNSIAFKSKKVIQKIKELNDKAIYLTGEIRLEEMNLSELTKQQESVKQYDSITETISQLEILQ